MTSSGLVPVNMSHTLVPQQSLENQSTDNRYKWLSAILIFSARG